MFLHRGFSLNQLSMNLNFTHPIHASFAILSLRFMNPRLISLVQLHATIGMRTINVQTFADVFSFSFVQNQEQNCVCSGQTLANRNTVQGATAQPCSVPVSQPR